MIVWRFIQKFHTKNTNRLKLYGESSFIIDALKYAITEYSDITIASIDIILSDIDPVCKDLYVLSLTEENELYIQPAYNGENMYRNEAKFAIVQDTVSSQLVKDMSVDDLSSTVWELLFLTSKNKCINVLTFSEYML